MSTAASTDAPGTCHLVGCPGKGQHPPHGIGCPDTFTPYTEPTTCLGFPIVFRWDSYLAARCSIDTSTGSWFVQGIERVTPDVMAKLVDQHRAECSNRSTR